MNKKSKILVLSEINKSIHKTITSAVNLAKIVNADIELFCVKKPSEIINKESQLSAIRTINKEYITASNKVKEILSDTEKASNININYKVSFGNLKNEISDYIKIINPDIIVLGRKKPKLLKFSGDNVMNLILKEFKGIVMIASDKNMFEASENLNPAVLNSANTLPKNDLINNLLSSIKKPLTSFKIIEGEAIKENNTTNSLHREFVFEKNDNVFKNISKYLAKSNINLLFIDNSNENFNKSKAKIQNIVNSIDCSLILSSN